MASVLYREVNKDTPEDAEVTELDGMSCEVGRFRASDVAGRLGSGWFGWPRPKKDEPQGESEVSAADLSAAKTKPIKAKL